MKSHFIKKLIAISVAGLFFINVPAQKVLLATSSGDMYSLDVSSGSCNTQRVTFPNSCSPNIFSIALYRDTVYFISNGALYRSVLNDPTPCKSLLPNVSSNALTVDRQGMLYWTSGFELMRFDPHTGALSDVGRLSFISAGDLVFYKDKLMMAALEGIVEIDLQARPVTSKLVVPATGRAFLGLFSLPVDCNNNRVYALESGVMSKIVEIDLDNKNILGTYCTLPFVVNDAASITESGVTPGVTVNSIDIRNQCGVDDKGNISVSASSATANTSLQYTLNNGNANSNGKFDALTAGAYALHISSSDGCVLDTALTIKMVDPIALNFTETPDTCEAKKGSVSIQKITGSEPFTFLLDNAVSQADPFFPGLSSGAHTLKVTDQNKCLLETGFTILPFSPLLPLSNIAVTPATCSGGGTIKITYLPSADITGARLDGNNFTVADNFSDVAAGTHHLQVKSSSCIFDTIIVVPASSVLTPVVSFTNQSPVCGNTNTGTSSLFVSDIAQPFTVDFNGMGYGPNTNFTGLAAGMYPFNLKDANGCVWKMTDSIPAFVAVKAFVQTSITNAECWQSQYGKVSLRISGAGSPYRFEINGRSYITGQEASQLPAGDYTVRILTAGNCAVDSVKITIKLQNSYGANCDTVYVPTAFTPNGDGLNDLLKPVVSSGTQTFIFRIYNRYGQAIYETHTAGEGWNGKWKGIPQPPATYVWALESKDATASKKTYGGTFVLIR